MNISRLARNQSMPDTHSRIVPGNPSPDGDHSPGETQVTTVTTGTTLPLRASELATPNDPPPVEGITSGRGQPKIYAHDTHAAAGTIPPPRAKSRPNSMTSTPVEGHISGETSDPAFTHDPFVSPEPATGSGQRSADTQTARAGAGPSPSNDQEGSGIQHGTVVAGLTSPGTGHVTPDIQQARARSGGWLRDPVLGLLAEVVDDLETVRIANTNRIRILTRAEADSDGEERGFGLTADHPEVAKLMTTVEMMKAGEIDAIKNLEHAMRRHPLGPFVKATPGLGLKQTARLLAAVGDPFWNDLHDRPRTVSELWAYCGFHVITTTSGGDHRRNEAHAAAVTTGTQRHSDDHLRLGIQSSHVVGVAPKRTRGQKSNWSETARKRVWIIASAIPKFKTSPYEPLYRAAREKYVDTVHPVPCPRCGPAGKPAPAGSPRSLGHQNAMAHRIVAKTILKDLWLQSKAIYDKDSQ